MERPLISVIVPIYGVEKYLDKCVKSILTQTYSNLEIILVDDGSPDRCGEIIDEYAQKDSRVVSLHKINGGLSDARNFAMPYAKGEFLTYIDSDDWVSPYYIENLYAAVSKDDADMAISWFRMMNEGTAQHFKSDNELNGYELLETEECIKRMLYQRGVETSAWGKLYKRSMADLLVYPTGKLYEDIPVTYKTMIRARRIAVIKNDDYYYLQRKTSIQNKSFSLRKLDAIEHMSALVDDVVSQFSGLECAAYCRYFNCVCNILFQVDTKEYSEIKDKLWNDIKTYRNGVMCDREAGIKSRVAAGCSFLGYGVMKAIYTVV